MQSVPTAEPATEPDTENVMCLGSWQQEDAIPLPPSWSTDHDTAIVDAGASGLFFKAGVPVSNMDKDAPKRRAETVTGEPHVSSAKCELARRELRGRVPIQLRGM